MRRALIFLVLACGCAREFPEQPAEGYNRTWEWAILPFTGRYEGLTQNQTHHALHSELRFGNLLRSLTAVDACDEDHGCFHIVKEDREKELWKLLAELPRYPGEARLILSTIDDVYLGFHWNGYHGYDFHWPYLNCFKATQLAERLAERHPSHVEDAMWTQIHCQRFVTSPKRKGESTDMEAGAIMEKWRGSLKKARELCRELLSQFPNGRYAKEARRLLELDDVGLEIHGVTSSPLGVRPVPRRDVDPGYRDLYGFIYRPDR